MEWLWTLLTIIALAAGIYELLVLLDVFSGDSLLKRRR